MTYEVLLVEGTTQEEPSGQACQYCKYCILRPRSGTNVCNDYTSMVHLFDSKFRLGSVCEMGTRGWFVMKANEEQQDKTVRMFFEKLEGVPWMSVIVGIALLVGIIVRCTTL